MLRDGNTEELIKADELPVVLSGNSVTLSLNKSAGQSLEEGSLDFAYSVSDQTGLRSSISRVIVSCSAISCEAGYFYNVALGACIACPGGTAEASSGMRSQCRGCPKGYYSKEGMATCLSCSLGYGEGYFTDTSHSASCRACPAGATCPDGKDVVVDRGKWRTGAHSMNILPCPITTSSGCIGGNGSKSQLCDDGYHGVMCAVCKDGFFSTQIGCKKCSGDEQVLISGFVLTISALVASVVVIGLFGQNLSNMSKMQYARARKRIICAVFDVAKFKVTLSHFSDEYQNHRLRWCRQ